MIHNFRILVPDNVLPQLVAWYHTVLGHAGEVNMYRTIGNVYYHRNLEREIRDQVQVCSACQQFKLPGRGFGHLAPREAYYQPWYEVAIDSIGPWTVRIGNQEVKFYATTIIDTVTNLTELQRINSPTAAASAWAMEQAWLFRYPRPVRLIHDQGPEFTGFEFKRMLRRWGIHPAQIGVRNPQANAICE